MAREIDRPKCEEQEAVRTTIVGGRPPGSGKSIGQVPRGIEVLVKKAAVDPQFRALLLARRGQAAQAIGLALSASESMLLSAAPAAQLESIIAATSVQPSHMPAFLGKVAAAMLAALGIIQGAGNSDANAAAGRAEGPANPRDNIAVSTRPTALTDAGDIAMAGERIARPTTGPAANPASQPAQLPPRPQIQPNVTVLGLLAPRPPVNRDWASPAADDGADEAFSAPDPEGDAVSARSPAVGPGIAVFGAMIQRPTTGAATKPASRPANATPVTQEIPDGIVKGLRPGNPPAPPAQPPPVILPDNMVVDGLRPDRPRVNRDWAEPAADPAAEETPTAPEAAEEPPTRPVVFGLRMDDPPARSATVPSTQPATKPLATPPAVVPISPPRGVIRAIRADRPPASRPATQPGQPQNDPIDFRGLTIVGAQIGRPRINRDWASPGPGPAPDEMSSAPNAAEDAPAPPPATQPLVQPPASRPAEQPPEPQFLRDYGVTFAAGIDRPRINRDWADPGPDAAPGDMASAPNAAEDAAAPTVVPGQSDESPSSPAATVPATQPTTQPMAKPPVVLPNIPRPVVHAIMADRPPASRPATQPAPGNIGPGRAPLMVAGIMINRPSVNRDWATPAPEPAADEMSSAPNAAEDAPAQPPVIHGLRADNPAQASAKPTTQPVVNPPASRPATQPVPPDANNPAQRFFLSAGDRIDRPPVNRDWATNVPKPDPNPPSKQGE